MVEAVAGRPVDVLVNNAGAYVGGDDSTLDRRGRHWRATFDSNVLTAVLLTEALRPLLRRPGGRIILTSSIAAQRGGGGPYSAAKAALHGFVFDLATQLGPEGITANVISPGYVTDSEFFAGRMTEEGHRKRVDATLVEPGRRAGRHRRSGPLAGRPRRRLRHRPDHQRQVTAASVLGRCSRRASAAYRSHRRRAAAAGEAAPRPRGSRRKPQRRPSVVDRPPVRWAACRSRRRSATGCPGRCRAVLPLRVGHPEHARAWSASVRVLRHRAVRRRGRVLGAKQHRGARRGHRVGSRVTPSGMRREQRDLPAGSDTHTVVCRLDRGASPQSLLVMRSNRLPESARRTSTSSAVPPASPFGSSPDRAPGLWHAGRLWTTGFLSVPAGRHAAWQK